MDMHHIPVSGFQHFSLSWKIKIGATGDSRSWRFDFNMIQGDMIRD